jgi:hypothetical protein
MSKEDEANVSPGRPVLALTLALYAFGLVTLALGRTWGAPRRKIVQGAVGMVDQALHLLSERRVVELDEDRKAAMVSTLMVVLCGEPQVSPIVNAGTLYR